MARTREILQANDDVIATLREAMRHVPPHLTGSVAQKFTALFKMYEEGHDWKVPAQCNVEGELEGRRKFYALKVKQVRCYGWYHRGSFVISHYVYKKQQKLSKSDIKKVHENYRAWLQTIGEGNEKI